LLPWETAPIALRRRFAQNLWRRDVNPRELQWLVRIRVGEFDMNWRGISGIYAGLAVVLGGAWLWMNYASVWALLAVGGGFVLAAASVTHIVLARRGPRPAQPAKASKVWQRKAAPVADDEADAIAKSRMAAIAGRTTGRTVRFEPEPEPVLAAAEVEPDALPAEPDPGEGAMAEPVGALFEPVSSTDEAESDEASKVEPGIDALSAVVTDEALVDDTHEALADEIVSDLNEVAAVEEPVLSSDACEPPVPEDTAHDTVDIVPDEEDAPVVALDTLPGFPWTARFIGLWAREVRYACPDDLRGAVGHWQRWADEQSAGTPLIEEAADEFKAMLSAWRECGADVPGLASDDPVARQLVDEAAEDVALAALLPTVLRVRRKQAA
jgi:hypothetical protein